MRTKITILSAAALAAGLLSSNAQVYSANIVGYVNKPVSAGVFYMLANPLSNDTNGASKVLSQIITDPNYDNSIIITFTPPATYQYSSYDQTSATWTDANNVLTTEPVLPPGKGFFFQQNGTLNGNITFVGQVVPSPGTTNTIAFAAGVNNLVGSPLPVSGFPDQTGPGNINLPDDNGGGAVILTFANNIYKYYTKDTGQWLDQNSVAWPGPPTISPAQGFFYVQSFAVTTNWSQTLTNSP